MEESFNLGTSPSSFSSEIGPLSIIYNVPFIKDADLEKSEDKFMLACSICEGRYIVEEYVVAEICPLSHAWKPNNIVYLKVSWYHTVVTFPHF
jgi:hypothetical protein